MDTTLERESSHKKFLSACLDRKVTPQAMQIKIKCGAMKAKTTDIQEQFQTILNEAEFKIMHGLVDHYDQIIPPLRNEKTKLVKEMVDVGKEVGEEAVFQTHRKDIRYRGRFES